MGILDNKTRMLDTILTIEGRKQLASGKLKAAFVTFTDGETFYEADSVSGSSDPTTRIFLEICSLPQDQITFKADESGKLTQYRGTTLGVIDGKVLSSSSDSFSEIVTGSQFMSASEELLGSAIDNFEKLYAIRTDEAFFDDERDFEVNTDSITFSITDKSPLGKREIKSISIDKVESLFQDKRLSHLPNFMYLPPVNKATTPGGHTTSLGNFPVIGQRSTPLTFDQIKAETSEKDQRIIDFSKTTLRSNVFCQIFEIKQDRLVKLDVIDYGQVITDDPIFPEKRVFFVGKVFIDSTGAQTFVNMFTLIYE